MKFLMFCLLLASALHCAGAAACTCVSNYPLETAIKDANIVLKGRVVEVTHEEGSPYVRFRMEVETLWKGKVKKNLDLFTSDNLGACGFFASNGEEVLFFAVENASTGTYFVNRCNRSKPLGEAGEDLAELGQGYPPENGEAPVGQSRGARRRLYFRYINDAQRGIWPTGASPMRESKPEI
jgi:hypothetical protein